MPAQYYDPQNPTGARHPRRHTNPPVRQSTPAPASGNYAGYSSPSAYAASGSGLHPHVALAAAHSGAVLDRVVSGLTPTMRSLAPKAVALAHHENLPASILLGVAQENGLAHPQGLVKVARRLKAADFHGQPHIAIGKVAPDVAAVLKAAHPLSALDKVPNPHAAHPGNAAPAPTPSATRRGALTARLVARDTGRVATTPRPVVLPPKAAVPHVGGKQIRKKLTKAAARAGGAGVPAGVPAQYRAAIAKYGKLVDPVAPAGMTGAEYLAGTIKFESGFNPNATGPSIPGGAAFGLGQFVPGTAASFKSQYGLDVLNPNKPDDMIHGAALHLSGKAGHAPLYAGYNPGYGSDPIPATARALGPSTSGKPIPKAVRQRAVQVLGRKVTHRIIRNQLTGQGRVGLPKGYVQPVKGGTLGRTDMGVDFSGSGAQIRAIGKARVVKLGGSGWPEGGGVVYQLLDGPRKGKYVYNYEGLTPTVKVGQVVKAGQQVASLTGSSIEIGWSDSAGTPLGHPSNTGQALPASHYTKQGAHFAKFIGGTAPAPTTGSASLLSGGTSGITSGVSTPAGVGMGVAPSSSGGRARGGSGGSGSLNSLLAALLPADFRAGSRVGQSQLADLLAAGSGNRPQRRLRTTR